MMVKMKIEAADFDPRFCRDGGSYYQPTIRLVCPQKREELVIDDSSCGDFGTRIDVTLYRKGRVVASASYGTMLDDGQEYSDFLPARHGFWLREAERVGYSIPTV